MKHPDSSDSAVSNRKPRPPLQGLNQTSWSPSEASQSAFNVSYPTMVPAYPLYPPTPAAPAQAPRPDPSLSTGFGEVQNTQAPATTTPFPAPIVTPVVALVLPNYLFPQIGQLGQMGSAPRPAYFTEQSQVQPAYSAPQPFQAAQPPYALQTQPPFSSQQPFPVQTAFSPPQPFQAAQTPFTAQQPFQGAQTAYTTQQPFAAQPPFTVQTQFVAQAPYPPQPFPYTIAPELPKAPAVEPREAAASRSSTPASGAREPTTSPPLFESRCSSPLQLNLLSMEEGQRSVERQDNTAPSAGGQASTAAAVSGGLGASGDKNGGATKTDNHQQVRPAGRLADTLWVWQHFNPRFPFRWNLRATARTVTGTPHPVTSWTSCCRNRRTPTLAPDRPPLALWALAPALAAMAAKPLPAKHPAAEQVS